MLRNSLDRFLGLQSMRAEGECMYLSQKAPGSILDVGCGGGERVQHFQQMGWRAEGQEVDPDAALRAHKLTGEKVHLCNIEAPEIQNNRYDAVVLHHVLEHVPRPVEFLQSCANMVAPGGTMVVTVPNFRSTRHRRFKHHWRGLEPPRHLFHFNPCNLITAAEKAGLLEAEVFTSIANAETFTLGCYEVKYDIPNSKLSKTMRSRAFFAQYFSIVEQWLAPDSGDESVLMWTKSSKDDANYREIG